MDVGVVIPAYNVGNRIDHVLSNVLKYIPARRIIVVDDGSSDETSQRARDRGVTLLRHPENRGKGEALKSGFREAIRQGLDGVITLDGDGQHAPDRIPCFVDQAEATGQDLVLGCRRFAVGEMPWDRILSNRLSTVLVSWLAGHPVRDSQCGFRFIQTWLLERVTLETQRYETETEFLVKALRMGCRVGFCPVPVIYDGGPSHIRRGRDTLRFLRLYLNLLIHRNVA